MSTAINQTSQADASPPSIGPARFTIEQFDLMIAGGAFDQIGSGHIELIRGEIIQMSPANPPHDYVLELLSKWAFNQTFTRQDELSIRNQSSMNIVTSASVPSPDLVIVKATSYMQRRPDPRDILLLVEVADSTLSYDLKDKMELYAEGGVREYWVFDIPHRSLIVHLDPQNGRYGNVQTVKEHAEVCSTIVSGLKLVPNSLLR